MNDNRDHRLHLLAAVTVLVTLLLLVNCSPAPVTPTAQPPTPSAIPTTEVPPTPVPAEPPVAEERSILPPLEDVSILVTVNGASITSETFGVELLRTAKLLGAQYGIDWYSEASMAMLPTLWDDTLEQLINQELLSQLAEEEDVTITDAELDATAQSTQDQVMSQGQYESWEAFLEEYLTDEKGFRKSLHSGLLFEKMIAVHGGPTETEQVQLRYLATLSEEEGEQYLQRIEDGETFEEVSQGVSMSSAAREEQGPLPWLPATVLPETMAEIAFDITLNEVSGLITAPDGFYIIQVLGREVRPVSEEMLSTYQQANFQQWLTEKRTEAEVEKLVDFSEIQKDN